MKGEALRTVEKLLDIMMNPLMAGEDTIVFGFGKWNVRSKHAR
jgi:nucleoid DNA-binding protein